MADAVREYTGTHTHTQTYVGQITHTPTLHAIVTNGMGSGTHTHTHSNTGD